MQVVSKIVCTSWASMSIKHTEEADLWPLNVNVGFVLGLQNVENDANSVLVVVSYDALVGVGCIWFNDATFFLACLGRLMVLQLNGLGVEWCWILTEEKGLHLHELDVAVFLLLRGQRCWRSDSWISVFDSSVGFSASRQAIGLWCTCTPSVNVAGGSGVVVSLLSLPRNWACLWVTRGCHNRSSRVATCSSSTRGPFLWIRLKTLAVSVETPLLTRYSCSIVSCNVVNGSVSLMSHAISCVVSSFYWTMTTHLIARVTLGRITGGTNSSWRTWRISNLHPWRERILQEDAALAIVLILMMPLNMLILADGTTRWYWMVMVSMRLLILKVMSWNSFPLWMLLSTCRSWIEEVVYALEGSTTLARNLSSAVFLHRVLELDIWKSGEHLTVGVDARTYLSAVGRSTIGESLVYWLPLLHLGVSCSFWSYGILMGPSSWRQWKHVVMMSSHLLRISSILVVDAPDVSCRGNTVSSVCSVIWCLNHGWQLKLLIVWVITFFSSVSFTTSHNFLF